MREWPSLIGQKYGMLTVIGQAPSTEKGQRRWICKCDCGTITYKATDTLTNPDISMCQDCAGAYAAEKARANAGFEAGTQIFKIKNRPETSDNLSGVRGVYLDRKTGKYRARLKFQGKLYNLGSFTRLEDVAKARKQGEEEIFGTFLAARESVTETS